MYCDFNSRLFKPFTSMKKEIKPMLSDDWIIVPESYRLNDGFGLKSEKLNQTVQDIDLRRFIRFMGEQELLIKGVKLKGTFIVGSDRSVYTEEMYNEWKVKFDDRASDLIEKKDLEVGCSYNTICGAEFYYVGSVYVSKLKKECLSKTYNSQPITWDFNKVTKNTKVHLIKWSERNRACKFPTGRKIAKKGTKKITQDEINTLLNYYKKSSTVSLVNLTKPSEKIIEINLIKLLGDEKGTVPFVTLKDRDGFYCLDTEEDYRTTSNYSFKSKRYVIPITYNNKYKKLPLIKCKIVDNKVIQTDEKVSIDSKHLDSIVQFSYKEK